MENNRLYKIMTQGGTIERCFMELLTYEEALEFCEVNDWVMCMDGGYIWDLVIEEM